jgi:hypothetical protein
MPEFGEWSPEEGWKARERVTVKRCPTCMEHSEFYECDVFGCGGIDIVYSMFSTSAGRRVRLCSHHSRMMFEGEAEEREYDD